MSREKKKEEEKESGRRSFPFREIITLDDNYICKGKERSVIRRVRKLVEEKERERERSRERVIEEREREQKRE